MYIAPHYGAGEVRVLCLGLGVRGLRRAGLPIPHIYTSYHTQTQSPTQPCTQSHRVSHRHTHRVTHALNHTKSHAGFGGSGRAPGRQLRKRPRSPPPPPHPPSCFLTQCQRPGRLGRGPGTARPRGGSRRRETRSDTAPGRAREGGPKNPQHTQGPAPGPPETTQPHPGTAPRAHSQHPLQTPFRNPVNLDRHLNVP